MNPVRVTASGQRGYPGRELPGFNLVHPGSRRAPTDIIRNEQAGRGIKLWNGVARRPMVD